MKEYRVKRACEVAGVWREAGAILPLTDQQARELAPPYGHVVTPVTKDAGEADGKLPRSKRSQRKAAD
ncbi:Hypothetical protein NGAL_HAMBI1146_58690 [Neorhizobium galegae bv. officinalis]|nr:Hypothetical protein NGAL_HAMBI1146_58690 [Neorhizobium galegae bv. officinalis]